MTSRPAQSGREADVPSQRLAVGGDDVWLSVYRIDGPDGRISLRSPHLFYYGIVDGRPVLHPEAADPIPLRPGQSLVVSPLQRIAFDSPDAENDATTYLALKIDKHQVRKIVENGAEDDFESAGTGQDRDYCHFQNGEGMDRVLRMIMYLFEENPPNRDQLIDLNARELIIQMLQTRSRSLLVEKLPRHTSTGGLAAAVRYIDKNLDRHISIDELVEVACMSKSSFYRHFSDEFEVAPLEYITRRRVIRARELLADASNTVTSVSHALGFSSTSHFIEMFKEHEGVTPKQYQLEVIP